MKSYSAISFSIISAFLNIVPSLNCLHTSAKNILYEYLGTDFQNMAKDRNKCSY